MNLDTFNGIALAVLLQSIPCLYAAYIAAKWSAHAR